jgi:AcrR family transcriptional regulator
MPKVSAEHKELRRAEILEAARRCFARYGYEGATVARLEKETGLSRGAIFNYFANKEALFVEVAVASSEQLTQLWLEQGFRALLDAIVHEDPDWLSVQFEATRRVRTDPEFRRLVEEREEQLKGRRDERLAQLQPQVRDDLPIGTTAIFLSLVANGLALRQSAGEPPPDLDAIAELVETGVRPVELRSAVQSSTVAP